MTVASESLSQAIARLAGFVAQWGRPHALVGGGAIVARVQPRLTTDLDLVIAVGPDDVDALLGVARTHGYVWNEAEARELLQAGLLRLWGPPGVGRGLGVDLMFVDSPFLESVVARAAPLSAGLASLAVASLEDLMLMKLDAGRPHDLDDAIAIKDAFAERLDLGYLTAWARQIGVERALASLLGEAPAP